MDLQNKDLLRSQFFINGEWIDAVSGATFSVDNPATGEVFLDLPKCASDDAQLAVLSAHAAFDSWRKTPAKTRSLFLERWLQLILENQEDLARILTTEQGKPFAEAKGEILYAASFVRWYAAEAERCLGEVIPSPYNDKRYMTLKQPVGVCAAITPWNFPSAMITRKIAPALAAGCTVVLKPSEETPLSALALAYLAQEAGLPKGVLNVIAGDAEGIGMLLTASAVVRKLSFTGSTAVGRLLMSLSASNLKRLSLELGGNAAFVVFDDADLAKALDAIRWAKFRSSGQSCIAANRILVQEGLYKQFYESLTEVVSGIKCGAGFEGADVGPLINDKAVQKAERLVKDAVEKGAIILTGGKVENGRFFQPTVLVDCTQGMQIFQEEIFAPIAAVGCFQTEEEAIAIANNTEMGLASYVMTSNMGRMWRVAEALETGLVGVNTGIMSDAATPFGGTKSSGFGKEGGHQGIEEYLETKYVCLDLS